MRGKGEITKVTRGTCVYIMYQSLCSKRPGHVSVCVIFNIGGSSKLTETIFLFNTLP